MTPAAFFGWVEQATSGETCVYHIGHLAADSMRGKRETMVAQSAALAFDLMTRGVARLSQKRLAEGSYEYRITMR